MNIAVLVFNLFLISTSAFAGNFCEFHYAFSINKAQNLITQLRQLNTHTDFAQKILSLKTSDQIVFKLYLEHFDIDLLRAQELYLANPSRYVVDDVFYFRRIILDEKYLPDYAQSSLERLNEFKSFLQRARNYAYDISSIRNPTEHEQIMDNIYRRIMDFYADRLTGFKYMQELEDRVVLESLRTHSNFLSQTQANRNRIKNETLHRILSEWEIKNGFKSVNEHFYEPRELPDRIYNAHGWANMLTEGHMFVDNIFDTTRALTDVTIDASHGAYTHRIQFYLLHRDIDKMPEYYHGQRGVDIFTSLGNVETNLKYLPPNTLYRDENSLWFTLFDYDGMETVYHSPDTFINLRERFWPHLGNWR